MADTPAAIYPTPGELLPDELAALDWTPVFPTNASPSWVGGDSQFYEGRGRDGSSILLRYLKPAATLRTDCSAVFTAMTAAGEAGLGPTILYQDPDRCVCLQQKLGDEWRPGTLHRLLDPVARKASVDVRLRFRQLDLDLPQVNIFEQISHLLEHLRTNQIEIPSTAHEVIRAVEESRGCMHDGPAAVACHGDGAASNVLCSSGQARLVGWTQVGVMDPLEEVGSLITELVPFVADAETVFEMAWPDRDPAALARARLYGVADDLRWALIGWCAQAWRKGSANEYQKYGNWRLLKARSAVTHGGHFERWMEEAR